jgi:hypothetical protein
MSKPLNPFEADVKSKLNKKSQNLSFGFAILN